MKSSGAIDVLIVEEDDDIRGALVEYLEAGGLSVEALASGRAAWELLKRGATPEVVVLDLVLPDLSGVELRTLMLTVPELVSIPVIIVTAQSRYAVDLRSRVAAILEKPFELAALGRLVARELTAKTPRRSC